MTNSKICVWHAINPTFRLDDTTQFPADFRKVAVVDTDDLDEAYRLTNSIDSPWWLNEGVTPTFPEADGGCRSTSVGDVMILENTALVVAPAGFELFKSK